MITISHLRYLSAVKSMKAIQAVTPAASPGNHCPMHTALNIAVRVEGLSTLVVGMPECSFYSRNIPTVAAKDKTSLHWTYVLDSKEVVFGCREGIISAIQELDAHGIKAILIIGTCIPELIGEDVESICYEMESLCSAKLVYLPVGHFKCGSYQPGYWKTFLALGKLAPSIDRKSNIVNILGISKEKKFSVIPEIMKIFDENNIKLRFISLGSTMEDFLCLGDAIVNINFSPYTVPLANYIAQEHMIPSFNMQAMYSEKDISSAYSELEHLLKIDILESQKVYKKKLLGLEQELILRKKETNYIMANIGEIQPLPLAAYLKDFHGNPIMIAMEEFYPSDTNWRKILLEKDADPIICLLLNEIEDQLIIESLCPSFVLGGWAGQKAGNIPTISVADFRCQIGYERSIALLERIVSIQGVQNGTL